MTFGRSKRWRRTQIRTGLGSLCSSALISGRRGIAGLWYVFTFLPLYLQNVVCNAFLDFLTLLQTTGQQFQAMHDARILRTSLEHWVARRRSLADLEVRVVLYADQSRTKYAFARWRRAIMEKKKMELQEGIKAKVNAVMYMTDSNVLRWAFRVRIAVAFRDWSLD